MKLFTFHLPNGQLAGGGARMKPFYRELVQGLRARGLKVDLVAHDRSRGLEQVEADHGFHVFDHGRVRHARALNSGIAYVYPFWNMDPWGIRAHSSIAAMKFDATLVPKAEAEEFHKRLRFRLIGKRQSRYPQPEEVTNLPQAALAVFLQSEAHRDVDETCYLNRNSMLETVLEVFRDRPVIVKPHPRDLTSDTFDWLEVLSTRHKNLVITSANIHDLLAACTRVITINSATAIEALVHDKPVILCGQADFHHQMQTAKTRDELAALLSDDPSPPQATPYLYWYFRMHCLAGGDDDLTDRFLEKVERQLTRA